MGRGHWYIYTILVQTTNGTAIIPSSIQNIWQVAPLQQLSMILLRCTLPDTKQARSYNQTCHPCTAKPAMLIQPDMPPWYDLTWASAKSCSHKVCLHAVQPGTHYSTALRHGTNYRPKEHVDTVDTAHTTDLQYTLIQTYSTR